jgi:hypothetical protein
LHHPRQKQYRRFRLSPAHADHVRLMLNAPFVAPLRLTDGIRPR